MEIPSDCVVLQASEITADESAMTGETDPIKKDTIENSIARRNEIRNEGGQNSANKNDVPSIVMLSGTKVLNGEGLMVVIVVGDDSCLGRV